MSKERRLEVSAMLKALLGSSNVYFHADQNTNMKYPAIVYKVDSYKSKHANDKPYAVTRAYQIMVIDANPDSEIPEKVAALPTAKWVTGYTTNGLTHSVFKINY